MFGVHHALIDRLIDICVTVSTVLLVSKNSFELDVNMMVYFMPIFGIFKIGLEKRISPLPLLT